MWKIEFRRNHEGSRTLRQSAICFFFFFEMQFHAGILFSPTADGNREWKNIKIFIWEWKFEGDSNFDSNLYEIFVRSMQYVLFFRLKLKSFLI